VLGIHISEERNMFVAENFIRSLVEISCWEIWKTYSLHKWWNMVSTGLQLFTFEASFTFFFWKEFDRKSNAVFQW
jgi:hypothetical protein